MELHDHVGRAGDLGRLAVLDRDLLVTARLHTFTGRGRPGDGSHPDREGVTETQSIGANPYNRRVGAVGGWSSDLLRRQRSAAGAGVIADLDIRRTLDAAALRRQRAVRVGGVGLEVPGAKVGLLVATVTPASEQPRAGVTVSRPVKDGISIAGVGRHGDREGVHSDAGIRGREALIAIVRTLDDHLEGGIGATVTGVADVGEGDFVGLTFLDVPLFGGRRWRADLRDATPVERHNVGNPTEAEALVGDSRADCPVHRQTSDERCQSERSEKAALSHDEDVFLLC